MKNPDLNLRILDWLLQEQMAGRSPATPDVAKAFELTIEETEAIKKELEEAGEFD